MTRLVKGIILRKQDYRESDRLFVIYTDEFGKISAVAKGVRKIKSKMAGHLELFSVINLMVAPGKNYYQIAGADREKNFLNIKNDLGKTVLASFCLEVLDIFTKTDHPDLKIYELLVETLQIFDKEKNKDFLKVYSLSKFFVLKLLSLLGWTPELYTCVKCKNKIMPGKNFFDADRGGLMCGKCGKSELPISTAAIKILRFVLKNDFKKIAALKITKVQIQELVKIIDVFLSVHQDRELKSVVWISYLTQTLKI
ncbi:DNA repair protein RecO [Patescibacteria group bacterium]|nr:DNA repair protein RecO [Patescibacteria group bacterium]